MANQPRRSPIRRQANDYSSRKLWLTMRIATELRVKALVRRCRVGGASAFVMRRGDSERGALYVKVSTLDGRALVFGPPPASFEVVADEEQLAAARGRLAFQELLAQQRKLTML